MNTPEYQAIKEYAQALQKQNQAKDFEQITLYRHLNTLEQELAHMEKYYFISSEMSREIQQMRRQLYEKDSKLAQFHVIERSSEEKTQLISKLQHLIMQKEQTIQKLQQQLQMMDDREYKMRQTLQNQKRLTSKLQVTYLNIQEQNNQLLEVIKQLRQQVENSGAMNGKQNQKSVGFCEQEIANLLEKYETMESQFLLQEQKCLALENQIVSFGFLLEAKDNELQAKKIKIRQLQSKLIYGEMKKSFSVSSKSSAKISVSEVFTEPLIKMNYDNEVKFNYKTGRPQLMKENNSMLQNEAKTQCNQKISSTKDEGKWKRKGQSRLQLRNKLLKIQNQSLLQQLSI